MPLILAGATSGSTTLQATDAVTATITLPSTSGTVQVSGSAGSFTSLTSSALTSGRVTYASTGGLLADSANLTFSGTTLSLNGLIRIDNGGNILGKSDNTGFPSIYGGGAYNSGAGIGLGGSSNSTLPNTIIFTRGAYVESARIDSSGNLGLGVTPSAWGYTALQVKNGAIYQHSATDFRVTQNAYIAAGNSPTYISTNAASMYRQDSGTHYWYTAPSGTAGAGISWTNPMTLDASGNLGVLGAITSNSKAVVTNITVASVPVGTTQISTNLTTSIGTAAGGWLIYATMGRGGASVADTYSAVYLYSATEAAYTPTLRTILASDAPGNNNGNISISGTTVVVSWGGSRGPAAVTAIKLW